MIDIFSLDRDSFPGTTRLFIDEIKRRKWRAYVIKLGSNHVFVDRGDGKRVHVFGSTPPQQSYVGGQLSNNKSITSLLLAQAGIPQLPFITIGRDYDKTELGDFISQCGKVVVKPIDGSHGNGIRAGVSTVQHAEGAIEYAREYSQLSNVLVQKQFPSELPFDIRILCSSGKFIASIYRLPARVFGDGSNTVAQLIDIENASERRGVAYKAPYATIDVKRAHNFLGDEAMKRVPYSGEEVRVMDVANYGAGGELIDVTDSIPGWMRSDAEKAAIEAEVTVAGVDYLASSLPTPESSRDEIDAIIIEINKSPSLMIHDQPHVGKNRQTIRVLADLVEDYVVV